MLRVPGSAFQKRVPFNGAARAHREDARRVGAEPRPGNYAQATVLTNTPGEPLQLIGRRVPGVPCSDLSCNLTSMEGKPAMGFLVNSPSCMFFCKGGRCLCQLNKQRNGSSVSRRHREKERQREGDKSFFPLVATGCDLFRFIKSVVFCARATCRKLLWWITWPPRIRSQILTRRH